MSNQATLISEQKPLISIIMNCYNGGKYLREAIDSILSQTYDNWEIIFWDNQSTDESAAIFKSYSDEHFRYFFAPLHTTLGQARNLAVEKADGEWVAFLDCDDIWFSQKLEKQVAIINQEGKDLGLVYGRSQILVEDRGMKTDLGRRMAAHRKEKTKKLPEGDIFPELLKWNFVPLLSGVVRQTAYWAVGGIDPIFKMAEDYDLFVKISKRYKSRAVQEDVCSYRVHDLNDSHKTIEACRESVEIVQRYLPRVEARKGLRYQQNCFAIEEIRQGNIFKGLGRLLMYGDILLFIYKLVKIVQKR